MSERDLSRGRWAGCPSWVPGVWTSFLGKILQEGTEPCVLDVRYIYIYLGERGAWLGLVVLKLEFVRGLRERQGVVWRELCTRTEPSRSLGRAWSWVRNTLPCNRLLCFYQVTEMFTVAFQLTLQKCPPSPSVALYHAHGILIFLFASKLKQLILVLRYIEHTFPLPRRIKSTHWKHLDLMNTELISSLLK